MTSGYAAPGALAKYLRVSPRHVKEYCVGWQLVPNRAGRFAWADIWRVLWAVREVPAGYHDRMKEPLLDNRDIAAKLGVSERSIQRDVTRTASRFELPRSIALTSRTRRHHPLLIEFWVANVLEPQWLRAAPRPTSVGGVTWRPEFAHTPRDRGAHAASRHDRS